MADDYFIVNYDKSVLPRPPAAENNGHSPVSLGALKSSLGDVHYKLLFQEILSDSELPFYISNKNSFLSF